MVGILLVVYNLFTNKYLTTIPFNILVLLHCMVSARLDLALLA